jgi:hypothetical protein
MKNLKLNLILLLLGFLSFSLHAETVDEQISAIINAPAETRVELVNEFKQTLAAMSAQDRASAIKQMRLSMHNTNQQTQTEIRTRVHQMNNEQDIQASQKMNQKHTATQAMNQGKTGLGKGGNK